MLLVGCIVLPGCGTKGGLSMKVVHGTVTAGGQTVDTGMVRFVPIQLTKGPASAGRIENGQYRVVARGGVPLGKHRVEVTALKKTGRKLKARGPFEEQMIDETVPMAPEQYAGSNSPLEFELTADSSGEHNIELPGTDAR